MNQLGPVTTGELGKLIAESKNYCFSDFEGDIERIKDFINKQTPFRVVRLKYEKGAIDFTACRKEHPS